MNSALPAAKTRSYWLFYHQI